MFSKIVLILCLTSVVYSDNGCNNVKCPRVPKHYKEIGCTPTNITNECCASRFECPDMANYDLNKCYWNGKTYDINELVPDDENIGMCTDLCACTEGHPAGKPAKFTCKTIRCPHFSNDDLKGCLKQSTLDGCCPKFLCDAEEKKSVSTGVCVVEGIIYKIGDIIYPESEQCFACICSANFDNTTLVDNPSCKEYSCGIGLRSFNYIRDGCIPSYYDSESCCPIAWRCPQDSDVMIPSKSRSSEPVDTRFQCQFGNLTLNIGDEIKSENNCDVCKCITPPMASCVMRAECKF